MKKFGRILSAGALFACTILTLTACATTEEGGNDSGWYIWPLLGVMIIGMYFMMIRPQSKQRQKQTEMLSQIKVGTEVMTGSGIRGEIVEINETNNSIVLKTGTDEHPSYLTFDKAAIYYLIKKKEDEPAADPLTAFAAELNKTENESAKPEEKQSEPILTENPTPDTSDGTKAKKTVKKGKKTLEEVESPKE